MATELDEAAKVHGEETPLEVVVYPSTTVSLRSTVDLKVARGHQTVTLWQRFSQDLLEPEVLNYILSRRDLLEHLQQETDLPAVSVY